jgi:hypothetical protein
MQISNPTNQFINFQWLLGSAFTIPPRTYGVTVSPSYLARATSWTAAQALAALQAALAALGGVTEAAAAAGAPTPYLIYSST